MTMHVTGLRIAIYAITILLGILTALPNLLTPQQLARLPDFLPKQQVTLGLDLRGGSHLVLEVDAASLVRERLQMLASQSRNDLRRAKIGVATIQRDGGSVTVTLEN